MFLTRKQVMSWLFYLDLIYKLVITTGNPLLLAKEVPKKTIGSLQCVLKLSEKYFADQKAMSGNIVIVSINSYTSSTQQMLFEAIHSDRKYSVMVKDPFRLHIYRTFFLEKAKNYMVMTEKKSDMKKMVRQLSRLPTWNPLAKAIAFYRLRPGDNPEDMAIAYINEFRSYKIFKSTIMLYSSQDDEVVTYSWTPYNGTNCGGYCDAVYMLDRCKNNVITQLESPRELFPLNMKGCPLTVYSVISEPYIMPPLRKLPHKSWHDVYEFQKGTEINLIKIISQFTNMSLVVRMSHLPENWGTVQLNGTATGAYEILRRDEVDFVIGNIEVTTTLRQWFETTVSYTQDERTWCVPKAGRAATWDNLVIIFQWSTWLATFSSVVVMGTAFHCLHYFEHRGQVTKWPTNSMLKTFGMLLSWSVSLGPKTATFRILTFGWLFFSLNMSISYESFLRSFLMHPRYEKQISSESDLIQSGIPVGGREIYRSNFEANNTNSFYLYRKYKSTTFDEGIQCAALTRNFAVVSSRRQAEYQDQKLGKGARLIYCFPEKNNLYKYAVVLLARKYFPMLQRFDRIIRSVSENGLIDKWNKEQIIISATAEETSPIVPLSIQHLLGAFMLIGILYVVSSVVFLGELIFFYLDGRKDDIIKCIRRFILLYVMKRHATSGHVADVEKVVNCIDDHLSLSE